MKMKRFALIAGSMLLSLGANATDGARLHEMVRVKPYVFLVNTLDAPTTEARVVLERDRGILSCFTAVPKTLGLQQDYRVVPSPEGVPYYCIDGQDALVALAQQKRLVRTWAISLGRGPTSCSTASAAGSAPDDTPPAQLQKRADAAIPRASVQELPKCTPTLHNQYDDPAPKCIGDDFTWTDEDGVEESGDFWSAFYGGGGAAGGGAQCMQECSLALSTLARICALAPEPIREACLIGAVALYVACIAGC